MRGKKTSFLRTTWLLEITAQEKLKTRSEILSNRVLQQVIRKDHNFMRSGGSQREVDKEVIKFRKNCWNKRSISYRRIFEGNVD